MSVKLILQCGYLNRTGRSSTPLVSIRIECIGLKGSTWSVYLTVEIVQVWSKSKL